MRSKEVDVSIKVLKHLTSECNPNNFNDFKSLFENYVSIPEQNKAIDTLLNYTSELEKENKFLRDENNIYKNETVGKKRIRDEIKLYELEIETLKTLYPKTYTTESDYLIYLIKIQVLKNILEK